MIYHGRRSLVNLTAGCLMGICALLAGCTGGQQTGGYQPRMGGDPAAGKALLQSYGCGACHVIPGIRTARGLVGPPLLYYSRRTIIAGELPNTPDNLARWIENPQAIEPATAMPNLGVPLDKAQDMAAYLYTLQ
jgi:cytochrome c2